MCPAGIGTLQALRRLFERRGGPNRWQVFVFAEGGFLSRLFGKDQSSSAVASAFAAVKHLLQQSPQVRALREES